MRSLMRSRPPTRYVSRQRSSNGSSVAHDSMISVNPMSLPPIETVTTLVVAFSALNCGGFGPKSTFCWTVMWSVFAPLHETSVTV